MPAFRCAGDRRPAEIDRWVSRRLCSRFTGSALRSTLSPTFTRQVSAPTSQRGREGLVGDAWLPFAPIGYRKFSLPYSVIPSDDVGRLGRFLDQLLGGRVDHLGSYKSQKSRWPRPESTTTPDRG